MMRGGWLGGGGASGENARPPRVVCALAQLRTLSLPLSLMQEDVNNLRLAFLVFVLFCFWNLI